MLVNLVIRLRYTGYLKAQQGGHAEKPPPCEIAIEEDILEIVENDPTTIIKSTAAQAEVIYSKV